jgi:hypothetical protein
MTAAITTLRGTIATALANAGVWTVFDYPPSTMQSSAVVVALPIHISRQAITHTQVLRPWLILRLL